MTGTVFIMFLAAMELMGTINTIQALYFTQIFEHFGFGRHSWKWCKFFGALATMNGNVIWFTTGMIAVTRAVAGSPIKAFGKESAQRKILGYFSQCPGSGVSH